MFTCLSRWFGVASLGLVLFGPSLSFAQDAPPTPDQSGVTVQARGPIHEAFAEPVTQGPQAGIIVPKQPPDPIPEQPPDVKPEGNNVLWVPGYWAWDPDKSDFLWVSGFWRNVPPGRRWVPGYWTQVANGWQWVSGFWADSNQQQLNYLPQPPASLDIGPSTPAPDDNSSYVPGNWIYGDSGYVWRPGYWLQALANWIWTPSSYYWTPSGYVYNPGYWDYPLANRGPLFCPVSFARPLWTNPGWFYTPQYVVTLPGLLASLWVQPSYGHYFFGNYYGPGYAGLGLQPWLGFGPRFYDPLFNYYNWAGGPRWFGRMNNLFVGRQNGFLTRPPRTLLAQNNLLNQANVNNQRFTNNSRNLRMVNRLTQSNNPNLHLVRLNQPQLQQQLNHARAIQNLRSERNRTEKPGGPSPGHLRLPPGGTTAGRANVPLRSQLPRRTGMGAPLTRRIAPTPQRPMHQPISRSALTPNRPLPGPRPATRFAPQTDATARPFVARPAPRRTFQPAQPTYRPARPAYRPPVQRAFHPAARPAWRPPAQRPFHPAPQRAFHPAARPAFHPAPRPAFRPAPRPAFHPPVRHR